MNDFVDELCVCERPDSYKQIQMQINALLLYKKKN